MKTDPAAKGIATSEGQATLLALIGAVVAALAPLDRVVQCVAIVSAAAVTVTYVVTRARVKITAVQTNLMPAGRRRRGETPE